LPTQLPLRALLINTSQATSELLSDKPGVYCEDCNISTQTDPESPMARYVGVDPHVCDDESAERLWSLSEDLLNQG
jgi:hypothetical protein